MVGRGCLFWCGKKGRSQSRSARSIQMPRPARLQHRSRRPARVPREQARDSKGCVLPLRAHPHCPPRQTGSRRNEENTARVMGAVQRRRPRVISVHYQLGARPPASRSRTRDMPTSAAATYARRGSATPLCPNHSPPTPRPAAKMVLEASMIVYAAPNRRGHALLTPTVSTIARPVVMAITCPRGGRRNKMRST